MGCRGKERKENRISLSSEGYEPCKKRKTGFEQFCAKNPSHFFCFEKRGRKEKKKRGKAFPNMFRAFGSGLNPGRPTAGKANYYEGENFFG